MKDNTNMDKLVREKLDDFTVAPPSHVWGNIQEQLAAERRKKSRLLIAWISAAAVVVFAFMAGWYFNDRTGGSNPDLFENQITQHNTKEEIKEIQNEKSSQSESGKEALVNESGNIHLAEAVKGESQKATIHLNENRNENKVIETVEKTSYQLLESLEAMFSFNSEEISLAEHKKPNVDRRITANDRLLIAENIRNNNKQKQKENGWIVGANLSAAYSSHSASYSQQYASNMTYSDNNHNSNVGGGISVQYKTGKRLRFESGVYYSPNGQATDNTSSGLFKFSSNSDLMYSPSDNVSDALSGIDIPVGISDEGISINSAAGIVNIDESPKGTLLTTRAESSVGYNNTLSSSGELSQVFEFVEVPLYARYSLVDKRFGLELMGGFNAGWLVGNNVYINNEYGKQQIGSVQDISTLNFSSTIGLGFNYSLSKHLSIGLEPRLNYYLKSISSNPEVNYRPYNIGIYTGVYYEF